MLKFLDQNNNPILPSPYPLSAPTGQEGEVLPVRFECREGYFLSAVVPSGVTAEARAEGDTAWINIEESPIDLTPYAPETADFELRVTPDEAGTTEAVFLIAETTDFLTGDGALLTGGGEYLYG